MGMVQSSQRKEKIYTPLVVTGIISGLILSWGLLSGDQNGRINLLYILLLYFLLPVVSLMLTLFSVIRGRSGSLVNRLLHTSIFNIQTNEQFRQLRTLRLDNLWLIQQLQLFMIVFSLASLVTFFFLLLFTDVTIIWRSTLLEPDDIYPVLTAIAFPWQFWQAAQPDLHVLQATQDFRTQIVQNNLTELAPWWPFVIATQLVYSIIPRVLIYLAIGFKLKQKNEHTADSEHEVQVDPTASHRGQIVSFTKLSEPLEMISWDSVPSEIGRRVCDMNSNAIHNQTNRWTPEAGDLKSLPRTGVPVILVKSWEAPMAELADQLTDFSGYILPLNWHDNDMTKPLEIHMDEWSRFAESAGWQLLQLDEECYE